MRDVVLGAFHGPGRLRHHEHRRARSLRDKIGELSRVPALVQDDLDALGGHLADERRDMLGRGRDSGSIFDDASLHQTEHAIEVRPAVVVAHDASAVERRQHFLPARLGHRHASQEGAAVGLEHRRVLGRDASQSAPDVRGDDRHVAGVQREVWTAERMDVAERAVNPPARDLQDRDPGRCLDDGGRAADHLRIVAAQGDHVDPGVFLEPVANEDVGPSQREHVARPDLHVMRILTEAGDHLDAGGVADQGLRDHVEIRQGGHDA